jgi:hypothetical protein
MALMGALVSAATATGAVAAKVPDHAGLKSFHAVLTGGGGTLTCTVKVEASNDGTNWVALGTITLSGTTGVNDAFSSETPWIYYRGNVTAITGTSASLTLTVGEV